MARQVVYTQRKSDPTGMFAIGVAVVALIFAFMAWNNTSRTPLQTQVDELSQSVQSISQKAAVEQARQQLQEVNRRFTENRNFEEAEQNISQIRQDLKNNFQNTGAEVQKSWQGVDDQLDIIEGKLKEKSSDVGEAIGALIENLKNFKFDVAPKAQ